MHDDDRNFLRDWGSHLTPTIDDNYDLLEKLDRVPICVACPMAQWYKREDKEAKPRLACFCIAYRGVMYDGGLAVTACDARADAVKAPEE